MGFHENGLGGIRTHPLVEISPVSFLLFYNISGRARLNQCASLDDTYFVFILQLAQIITRPHFEIAKTPYVLLLEEIISNIIEAFKLIEKVTNF